MKPASAKAKGRRLERRFASTIGGRRTPLSGAVGGGDASPTDATNPIWRDWSWECKARATLPVWATRVLAQAAGDIGIGDPRNPAAILAEDGGRMLFVAFWDDVRQWAEALAETGRRHQLRALARQLDAVAVELRRIG